MRQRFASCESQLARTLRHSGAPHEQCHFSAVAEAGPRADAVRGQRLRSAAISTGTDCIACRIALSTYSAHVAGVYGEVQNLGSLAVRLVFWPVETSAFRVFSRRSAATPGSQSADADQSAVPRTNAADSPQPGDPATASAADPPASRVRRRASGDGQGTPQQQTEPANDTAAATAIDNVRNLPLLQALHRFVLLVAAVAAVFGPNYAFTAVHILLSWRWSASEAPALLASYSLFLSTLAVNGVTEAYAHARMSGAELARANGFLAVVTAAQAAAIVAARALGLGSHALVALDAASMVARIAYSYRFVWGLHGGAVGCVWLWVPSVGSCAALSLAFAGLCLSKARMQRGLASVDLAAGPRVPRAMLVHIGVGAAVLACLLAVLVATERALIARVRGAVKRHRD